MPFLSRRSVDPLPTPVSAHRDKAYASSSLHQAQASASRSRARSDASLLFRRVSTLFSSSRRRRSTPNPPKASSVSFSPVLNVNASSAAGIGHICHTFPRSTILPRLSSSSDSSSQSSLEIRRPSGLGRRASLIGSSDDEEEEEDAESYGKAIGPGERTIGREDSTAVAVPTGYVSLPNLLGVRLFYPPERQHSDLALPCSSSSLSSSPPPPTSMHHAMRSRRGATVPEQRLPLPDPLFRAVLEFVPRKDLPVVALVSRGFCTAARYALYHILDVAEETMPLANASCLEKLFGVLASRKELAALVVSFCSHSWPSWEVGLPGKDKEVAGRCHAAAAAALSIPSDDVRQAFQNMYNLKSLVIPLFPTILSHTLSIVFSLTHLTVLDKKMSRSQLQTLCSWLATQRSLESLSFPHLVEYANTDPSIIDGWVGSKDAAAASDSSQENLNGPFTTLLPPLKSLRASTNIISALCFAFNNPIEHLTLDVHETLFSGLRPSSVIRSFMSGVREMHVIFGPEVDKRTVEKFLGVTGSILTGEGKLEATTPLKSLEVEVLWTDDDAAEMLYGIVTSIISRFRGLETLKLTSPFRSIQASFPNPVSLSLIGSPNPIRLPPGVPSSSARSRLSMQSRRCSSNTTTTTTTGTTGATMTMTTTATSTPVMSTTVVKEFVVCDVEKTYARTWTRHCPSLSNIKFDFSCSTAEAEVDIELCGVWFRRRMPALSPSRAAT